MKPGTQHVEESHRVTLDTPGSRCPTLRERVMPGSSEGQSHDGLSSAADYLAPRVQTPPTVVRLHRRQPALAGSVDDATGDGETR